jgi:hypothetical protein
VNYDDPFGLCWQRGNSTQSEYCAPEQGVEVIPSDATVDKMENVATVVGMADGEGEAVGVIKIGEKQLAHVVERHAAGSLAENASKFAAGEDIPALIKGAEGTARAEAGRAGTFQRIVNAGRAIGTDLEKEVTHIYTVITDEVDNLITAHPGVPK